MTIASWSPRTVVWLWIGMLSCYAILIAAGAVQERARRASEPPMDIGLAPAETTQTTLSPAQVARRDSLVDSLKRLGRSFLEFARRAGHGQESHHSFDRSDRGRPLGPCAASYSGGGLAYHHTCLVRPPAGRGQARRCLTCA